MSVYKIHKKHRQLSFRLGRNLFSKQSPLSPHPKGESEGFLTSRNDKDRNRLYYESDSERIPRSLLRG